MLFIDFFSFGIYNDNINPDMHDIVRNIKRKREIE